VYVLRYPIPKQVRQKKTTMATVRHVAVKLDVILTVSRSDDDNMEEEDVDDDNDAAEEDEGVADVMIDEPSGRPSGDSAFAQLSPLLEPLLHLAQPIALSFAPADGPSPHPPTTSALGAVHVCALECLNNLFLGLAAAQRPAISANAQAGAAVWGQLWAALLAAGTSEGPGQERRRDMWETGVGVLWGVASVWKGVLVGCSPVALDT
jgi:hypothetical protein